MSAILFKFHVSEQIVHLASRLLRSPQSNTLGFITSTLHSIRGELCYKVHKKLLASTASAGLVRLQHHKCQTEIPKIIYNIRLLPRKRAVDLVRYTVTINSSIIHLTNLILKHLVRRHFMFILEFRRTLGARCWHTVLESFPLRR